MQMSRQTPDPADDVPPVSQQTSKKYGSSLGTGASHVSPPDETEQEVKDVRELQYEWYWSM